MSVQLIKQTETNSPEFGRYRQAVFLVESSRGVQFNVIYGGFVSEGYGYSVYRIPKGIQRKSMGKHFYDEQELLDSYKSIQGELKQVIAQCYVLDSKLARNETSELFSKALLQQ